MLILYSLWEKQQTAKAKKKLLGTTAVSRTVTERGIWNSCKRPPYI